jgi:hypothetical protein
MQQETQASNSVQQPSNSLQLRGGGKGSGAAAVGDVPAGGGEGAAPGAAARAPRLVRRRGRRAAPGQQLRAPCSRGLGRGRRGEPPHCAQAGQSWAAWARGGAPAWLAGAHRPQSFILPPLQQPDL